MNLSFEFQLKVRSDQLTSGNTASLRDVAAFVGIAKVPGLICCLSELAFGEELACAPLVHSMLLDDLNKQLKKAGRQVVSQNSYKEIATGDSMVGEWASEVLGKVESKSDLAAVTYAFLVVIKDLEVWGKTHKYHDREAPIVSKVCTGLRTASELIIEELTGRASPSH